MTEQRPAVWKSVVLRAGSLYDPCEERAEAEEGRDPGAHRLARFDELDEAFHGQLERRVEAGARNDVPGTSQAFAGAVRACQDCHAELRE